MTTTLEAPVLDTPARVNTARISISAAHTSYAFQYIVNLDGHKVGGVSLTTQSRYPDTLWIAGSADIPNSGVMSAAGAHILHALCTDADVAAAGITKVYTYIHCDNHASNAVVVKFGFVELPSDRADIRRWLAHLPR